MYGQTKKEKQRKGRWKGRARRKHSEADHRLGDTGAPTETEGVKNWLTLAF